MNFSRKYFPEVLRGERDSRAIIKVRSDIIGNLTFFRLTTPNFDLAARECHYHYGHKSRSLIRRRKFASTGSCVYFPVDVSLKESSCEKFFSTPHKYYDLFFCDKIKKIRAVTHRTESKWNFLSLSFQFSFPSEMRRAAVGFIKFGLLGRDGAAAKRMWLHQRRAGKGVVAEEEAAWWEYQTTIGCDKQNNADNGGNAWLWDEVSLLFARYLMELRFLTTLSWITGNLITDLTFNGNVRRMSDFICRLGWKTGWRRKCGTFWRQIRGLSFELLTDWRCFKHVSPLNWKN